MDREKYYEYILLILPVHSALYIRRIRRGLIQGGFPSSAASCLPKKGFLFPDSGPALATVHRGPFRSIIIADSSEGKQTERVDVSDVVTARY